MAAPVTPHTATHTAVLKALATRAYAVVADVLDWPLYFTPCLHAQVLDSAPDGERIRLWALVGDEVRSWTSRRTFDPAGLRIGFRQENSRAPLASMGGHWAFTAEPAEGTSTLVLAHDWTLTDDAPAAARWVAEALDRNSTAEVAAVVSWAERTETAGELMFSFTDETTIDGPPSEAYAFLYRADLWPDRLPHVARLDLDTTAADEATGGAEVQTLEMDTAAADGTAHTTRSVRLCFPSSAGSPARIVYKQTTVPRPLLGHSGEWTVTATEDGRTRVTARHSVALDPDDITTYFGTGTNLADARTKVRDALGGNSRRTLAAARAHVESGRR
ncbi:aromatase/cyclase [Streptomyces sp. VRA16 Mangrove soil]|uniref:aromatase/cyclase n=1 Tax=Streptomyces sp. VRA16 Mangrove soil TaxID=2817434 RepID=UPI001A9CD846|nr:aromatase/cyclase [Streptomyces sp. VRA16 Mangrove soil]MBO1332631.1 aromatase/cyclase [Streptomyces sp. VRA16 Mangrove soil]